ncbi:hypothetical protein SRED_003013 [Spiroplasma melliferum]|uniref:Spiroplasmavirus-related protein n=1 Tax=Spiroplasma melliferum TaxID=2134 RepID=A0ABX5UAY3_SPIME|nr:hypothetical protein SRED_003013 [Spiroplasma melliferum]
MKSSFLIANYTRFYIIKLLDIECFITNKGFNIKENYYVIIIAMFFNEAINGRRHFKDGNIRRIEKFI